MIDPFKRASFPHPGDWFKEFNRWWRRVLKRKGRRQLKRELRKAGDAMR